MAPPTVGKRCITYGTFDLFHHGHMRLLERARALGSHLIVAVTSDGFDAARGKLNVRQTLVERIEALQKSGLADQIIVEEYHGQKVHDIVKYKVDVFVIGSDWRGTFDYLASYCEVVYLERTAGISSSQLRGELRLGIVGSGRIAARFAREAKFVSGVRITGIFSRSLSSATAFAAEWGIPHYFDTVEALLDAVDAIYIASPHLTHASYARTALQAGRHVLCEKPLCFTSQEAQGLYTLASERGVVLLEAIKTAFMPGFRQMVAAAQTGQVGKICFVSATCTMLKPPTGREYDIEQAGGSITELVSYPLLAVVKLLGPGQIQSVSSKSIRDSRSGIDIFSRVDAVADGALASGTVALGVKAEGDLVVAGTEGYIYVPAPWWLIRSFQLRFEDPTKCREISTLMEGDGLRYELAEFIKMITEGRSESPDLTPKDSCAIAWCIERARSECQTIGVQ
ncbi:hypothetical protein HIM_08336 [Hirsutella minnesotensis 3608]|uniref:D-xylose 1-dehydrogenase (NADP(+), D-xylono-1,5-lactone-forming) n=1 Tax=Hirsutella minnesotensis 3608 TaxID=1043627 RepID=A0A0F7ZMN2_9HYPO|nr:hypothetical protein HIM_08336 [Hirsutella minnesotensis 3608]